MAWLVYCRLADPHALNDTPYVVSHGALFSLCFTRSVPLCFTRAIYFLDVDRTVVVSLRGVKNTHASHIVRGCTLACAIKFLVQIPTCVGPQLLVCIRFQQFARAVTILG